MEVSFSYHFVLFLDVLGFSAIVSRETQQPGSAVGVSALYGAFTRAKKTFKNVEGYDLKQFSDSIILSTPYRIEEASPFVMNCGLLQRLMLSEGILTRGGLTVGKHFSDRDFVASQGVIDAYRLEQSAARFPRIIVSSDLIELCYPDKDMSGVPFASYVDGATFVDFLRNPEDKATTRTHIMGHWANSGTLPWSAREKIHWLVSYWNASHPDQALTLPNSFEFF